MSIPTTTPNKSAAGGRRTLQSIETSAPIPSREGRMTPSSKTARTAGQYVRFSSASSASRSSQHDIASNSPNTGTTPPLRPSPQSSHVNIDNVQLTQAGDGAPEEPQSLSSSPPLSPEHPGSTTRRPIMKIGFAALCAAIVGVSAFSIEQLLLPNELWPSKAPQTLAEVPGNSPIETCLEEEAQLVDIARVDLDPELPIPGTNLTIAASGTLKTDLVDGAYVDILVRYGFITLVNRRYDLCELLPEVDLECPVRAGYLDLVRTVEIPDQVPPGDYSIEAKAYTVDEELLTCLTAVVTIDA